ncbi:MAG TPA: sulfotransferase [Rhizomicrobium sp.]
MLDEGRAREAKSATSKYLAKYPRDADALNLMANLAERDGRNDLAESFLAQGVRWQPECEIYRYNYAVLLSKIGKVAGAIAEAEVLLEKSPTNILYCRLKAALLSRSERYDEALSFYRELTEKYPDSAEFWIGLGSALRSLGGYTKECIVAFRTAAKICPSMGTAWWSLASLKTVRFTSDDIDIMELQFVRSAISGEQRANLHYALGKAYGDLKEYEKSFGHYSKGNAIRRIGLDYDADETTFMVTRAKTVFTPKFFREKAGMGCSSAAPIFVLGLQRAGSTLVEQILGSHSAIEPSGELPFVLKVVGEDVMPKTGPDYPFGMDRLESADARNLGEKYLALAHGKRSSGRPYFVDKCPFNLWHVGLIHLMLPNAKIIDVRRHPLGCCFANFTMNFAHAPPLSYKLSDIGRFYADYVRLMSHFDRVLPGKIHRVIYEDLVSDVETEVRRILEFLELPFDARCLEYYKTDRAFNSFSNEQVRSPIFNDGVERWRNYEPWLGPLRMALGPVLELYPDVPEFDL